MKAKLNKTFLKLFLYDSEIDDDDQVEVDYECLMRFNEGDPVEILKVIEPGEYAKDQKSYVIFNPKTKESTTVAAVFVTLI